MSDHANNLSNGVLSEGYLAVIEALNADWSISNLINECQRLLGNPVQLLNDSFEILATSSNEALPVSDEKWLANAEVGRLQRECIENLRENRTLSRVNQTDLPVHVLNTSKNDTGNKSNTWLCRTAHNSQVSGYIVVLECYRDLDSNDEQILTAFAKAISVARRIEHGEINLNASRAEALVERLLANPSGHGTVVELTRRLNQLKLLPKNDIALLTVRVEDHGKDGIPLNYYKNRLQDIFRDANTFQYESDLVCLLHCTGTFRSGYLPDDEYSKLESFLTENGFHAAISRVFQDLSFLGKAYRETDAALRLAKRMKMPYKLHRYERNLAFYPLLAYESDEEVRDLCHPGILRIYQQDCQRESNLLHTLEVYLANNLNAYQTATQLNLHRNSLYYRLEKIEELLGRELGKDSKLDFQLQYSILVLKYLGVVPLDEKNPGV